MGPANSLFWWTKQKCGRTYKKKPKLTKDKCKINILRFKNIHILSDWKKLLYLTHGCRARIKIGPMLRFIHATEVDFYLLFFFFVKKIQQQKIAGPVSQFFIVLILRDVKEPTHCSKRVRHGVCGVVV